MQFGEKGAGSQGIESEFMASRFRAAASVRRADPSSYPASTVSAGVPYRPLGFGGTDGTHTPAHGAVSTPSSLGALNGHGGNPPMAQLNYLRSHAKKHGMTSSSVFVAFGVVLFFVVLFSEPAKQPPPPAEHLDIPSSWNTGSRTTGASSSHDQTASARSQHHRTSQRTETSESRSAPDPEDGFPTDDERGPSSGSNDMGSKTSLSEHGPSDTDANRGGGGHDGSNVVQESQASSSSGGAGGGPESIAHEQNDGSSEVPVNGRSPSLSAEVVAAPAVSGTDGVEQSGTNAVPESDAQPDGEGAKSVGESSSLAEANGEESSSKEEQIPEASVPDEGGEAEPVILGEKQRKERIDKEGFISDFKFSREPLFRSSKEGLMEKLQGRSLIPTNIPPGAEIVKQKFAERIIVSEKNKMLYCPVPKAGNSNWKVLIRKHEGFHNYRLLDVANNKNINGLTYLSQLPPERVDEILRDPSWFRFSIVRDPYKRHLSCYMNKFVQKAKSTEEYQNFYKQLIHYRFTPQQITEAEKPTFREFTQHIQRKHPQYLNEHWNHQYYICGFGMVPFDFIGKLENIVNDSAIAFDALNWDGEVFPSQAQIGFHSSGSNNKLAEYYDSFIYESVSDKFARDLEILGYPVIREAPEAPPA